MSKRYRLRAVVLNHLMERYKAGDKSGLTIMDVIKLTKLSYDEARRLMVEIAALHENVEYERGRLHVIEGV